MFNTLTLAALLATTIGYRPVAGAPDELTSLPNDLLAPDGELAVQDVHPLLTLRNIQQAAPQMPAAAFPDFLKTARVTAATKVLQSFREQKQLTGTGKRLLQDLPLTEASGAYRDKIIRQGRFVGLALKMRPGMQDIGVRVTAIGTQFTEREPNFRLVVLHSSDLDTPVAELEIPRIDRVYFEWSKLSQSIDLASKSGGTWYFGYYEDELSGQAIRLDQNLQQRPGQCCGNAYVQYDKWSPYVQVLPFSQAALSDDITYQSNTNWGLNLRLEATCDLTQRLAGQVPSFAAAVREQLAVNLLSLMAYSTRDNGLADKTKALALMELNNRTDGQPGLLTQLSRTLKALDVDISGVSATCLPCAPKPGAIKFKSIG
ncbi:hypothetical protein [Hymenobacter rigui]|uniref:Uncharacterized protein n=1 Tax=Hymenobacter rigui TaxID=334424 RepID=A0A428KU44_9BACT|nr:hypothetical protein [Hymenobacter rigui]RSK50102.1 hypothetical protein EI291_05475 [Hymenobacter rigui]